MAKSWSGIAKSICNGHNSRSNKDSGRQSRKDSGAKADPSKPASRDYVAGKNLSGKFQVETRPLTRKK